MSISFWKMIPCGINGLALGLSGAASVFLSMPWGSLEICSMVCTCISGALWLAFTIDRICNPSVLLKDFQAPATISTYGAYQMTFLFVTLRLLPSSAVAVCVWIGAAAQLALMVTFLKACRDAGLPPEPVYNPPTVNCAVTAIVASSLDQRELACASFILAVVLASILVPPQTYRVLRDDAVSATAAVAMLQAPWSLNALTWNIMSTSTSYLTHLLFALSTVFFYVTLYSVWRRRRPIFTERGFGLDWAAFTFPSCSTAVAALQYSDIASSWRLAATIYSVGLAVLVLAVVACVVLGNAYLLLRSRKRINGDDNHPTPVVVLKEEQQVQQGDEEEVEVTRENR